MLKYLFSLSLLFTILTNLVANEQIPNEVDCVILKDENSIICKYTHQRSDNEKEILIQWIDPNNEISRERKVTIPAGHASIYDYRYKDGRIKGTWVFKVTDNSKEYTTKFTLE